MKEIWWQGISTEEQITNENYRVGTHSNNRNKKFTRWDHKLMPCGRTRVSGLEETSTETLHSREQKDKTSKKNEQNFRFCFDWTQRQINKKTRTWTCGWLTSSSQHICGESPRKRGEREKTNSWRNCVQKLAKYDKKINLQTQSQ